MKKTYSVVESIWNSHNEYLGKEQQELKNFDITHFMANLFCPGEYYYYIIDSPTLTFDMVSETTRNLLGIEPKDFSLQKMFSIVHPDDIEFVMKCEDIVAYFLKNCIPIEKMTKYKISYCLREKTADKGYRLFLLQTITIKTTESGALLKVFGSQTDISHITTQNNHKLSFIGLDGEPSILGIDVFNKSVLDDYIPFNFNTTEIDMPYTKRELEIIKQLALGITTNEIAEKLFIAKNTVETHRRNILSKSQSRNTTELVVECLRKGYI